MAELVLSHVVDFLAERENRVQRHFEMLQAQRYAYYGDAEYQAASQVDQSYLPPAQQYPDKVHHYCQAAGLLRFVLQFAPKRTQRIGAQLKELDTKGYTDYGDAHDKAHQIVYQGYYQAAKYQPDNVSKGFHNNAVKIVKVGIKYAVPT